MMAWVHAAVGAALGRLIGHQGKAFGAGVASHAICDLIPHRDLKPIQEAPLLALALGLIVWRKGLTSPETLGAIGAVSPDTENIAMHLGVIPKNAMLFPTHQGPTTHGREVKSITPQVALAAVCLAVALWPEKSSTK
ncbi:hypothetical protein [Armatimonas sp.]|uniref:hypothetical protein n=1 Tax=Armatimonas sp. TaxID=1872638 RepID=UPI00286B66A4|nr:hypothetical protein [Armatimonas sp.]